MDNNEGGPHEYDRFAAWQRINENDPHTTKLHLRLEQNIMTNVDWEQLGRDISSNTYLQYVRLTEGALNDRKMSFFFRGLTRSSSIGSMQLCENQLTAAGVRSMVPFLQSAKNLMYLILNGNNIQSEGFNMLLRALRDSPIKWLRCDGCDIESIEIDSEQKPKHLKKLWLHDNIINADGCRGLAKLLQGSDSTLTHLHLDANQIDDEGVGILVHALQKNTSLVSLDLARNNGISKQGQSLLLKLVNNISSIKATFQSNHTLKRLYVDPLVSVKYIYIQAYIFTTTSINREEGNRNPAAAARAKVIKTQLHSGVRTKMAGFQGVGQSIYSEINPLHLPEVIALVGRHHGQGELYVALKSSIAGVISTVNRNQCLQQQRAYHRAGIDGIEAEIATTEGAEASLEDIRNESRSNKRRRKWWWGLWGRA